MYSSAFDFGAPFKLPKQALPASLVKDIWRNMPADLVDEFYISELLVNKFNAWRVLTLNLLSNEAESSDGSLQYNPIRASSNVITALENQLGWITAWRIGRYVNGAYKSQGFYKSSGVAWQNKDSDPATLAASKAEQEQKQKDVDDERLTAIVDNRFKKFTPLPPGPKDFDPAIAQVQLRQAAEEFNADYQSKPRPVTGNWKYTVSQQLSNVIYSFSENDFSVEYERIKSSGDSKFNKLFPKQSAGETAQSPESLVRSLFDDQVHDSRAWFMHATFGDREPWGSYFLYRMIFFVELMSKNVPLIAKYGRFVEGQLKSAIKGASLIFDNTTINSNISDEITSGIKQVISIIPASASGPEVINAESIIQPAMTNGIAPLGSQTRKALDAAKLAETKADILKIW